MSSELEYVLHSANVLSRWAHELANEVGVLEGTTSVKRSCVWAINRGPAKHVALWEEEQGVECRGGE